MDRLPKRFAAVLVAALAVAAPLNAQEAYPAKPVRWVVPYAAGGLPDTIARVLAQKVSESLGQQVTIENRGGAGGITGTEAVARAAPDGYTFLVADVGQVAINPFLYAKLPYDPAKDFAPVGLLATANLFLVANQSVPVKDFGELVALARAKPGVLNYGSSGVGSIHHLSMESLKAALGLVGKEHGVAVERDPQLVGLLDVLADVRRQDLRRGVAGVERPADVLAVRREEEVRVERRDVGIGTLAAGERRAGDVEPVVLDRVHDPQAGLGGVAREQDHFDPRARRCARVEGEELLHQRQRDARREHLVLARELVAMIGLDALFLEHAVRLLQVEQRTGGDRDYELAVEGNGHRGSVGGRTRQRRRF